MATNNPTNPDAELDCRYWPADVPAPVAPVWRLVSFEQRERPTGTCDLCGHDIAQIFYIQSDDVRRAVGCECINTFLTPDDRNRADLLKRRANRAAKQWREKNPAPRDGETRPQYIDRRMREMDNAMRAYKASLKLDVNKFRMAALRDIKDQFEGVSYAEWCRVASETERNVLDLMYGRLEQQYNANRYDFNRPIWDVRKA